MPLTSDKRYWQTADKERLVEEGDPAARFLFAVEGDEISDEDAARYGLTAPAQADAPQVTFTPAPELVEEVAPEEKAAPAKANKAKGAPENKGK